MYCRSRRAIFQLAHKWTMQFQRSETFKLNAPLYLQNSILDFTWLCSKWCNLSKLSRNIWKMPSQKRCQKPCWVARETQSFCTLNFEYSYWNFAPFYVLFLAVKCFCKCFRFWWWLWCRSWQKYRWKKFPRRYSIHCTYSVMTLIVDGTYIVEMEIAA